MDVETIQRGTGIFLVIGEEAHPAFFRRDEEGRITGLTVTIVGEGEFILPLESA